TATVHPTLSGGKLGIPISIRPLFLEKIPSSIRGAGRHGGKPQPLGKVGFGAQKVKFEGFYLFATGSSKVIR
ncbi:MAG: hypothetical protein KC931_19925, partial [Candidatus Omnitrophica bacterium]|nr:hypothetical protein [Candidatus Omnitrophota bacterium]